MGCTCLMTTALLSPTPVTADTLTSQSAPGCCEALPMVAFATPEVSVLGYRGLLKKSVPQGWAGTDRTPTFYIPRNKKMRLVGVLGVPPLTKRSRGRYRFELECLAPNYRKATAWTWVNVPGSPHKSPASPIVPARNVYGSLNSGNCTNGFVWFQYDKGDARYRLTSVFNLKPARKRSVPRQITVWKWVTSGQAATVRRTGKYPMPKGTYVGQYFFTNLAYANKVRGHFRGHRLVRGTLRSSDLLFFYTENKRTDTGIVGGFFRKQLAQPRRTFKVVR
ncbi:hypothetical protein GCM10010411_70800 [Actinomadura fulvescens]|uniref:Polysaccharide lyase-like protein n=2 Tax=Actinomadura fulvescens TaxID=46160 RepID=A0ABP6CSX6_9ACTN